MTEIRTPLTPVRVEKACTCAAGRMIGTGVASLSHPPRYENKCNSCDKRAVFDVSYPYIDYQVVEAIDYVDQT